MNQHVDIYVIPEHQWEQEKMREAGHQGRRTWSGACSGVPARAPGSSLLRRSQRAAQKCKHSHLCSPHRGLLPPDPVHAQRSLIRSASLSLALPLNTILTQMWLISDSSPSSTLAVLWDEDWVLPIHSAKGSFSTWEAPDILLVESEGPLASVLRDRVRDSFSELQASSTPDRKGRSQDPESPLPCSSRNYKQHEIQSPEFQNGLYFLLAMTQSQVI